MKRIHQNDSFFWNLMVSSISIKLSLTFRLFDQTQNSSPSQITRLINKHCCKDEVIHSPQFHECISYLNDGYFVAMHFSILSIERTEQISFRTWTKTLRRSGPAKMRNFQERWAINLFHEWAERNVSISDGCWIRGPLREKCMKTPFPRYQTTGAFPAFHFFKTKWKYLK